MKHKPLPIDRNFIDLAQKRAKEILKYYGYGLTFEMLLARIYTQGFIDAVYTLDQQPKAKSNE